MDERTSQLRRDAHHGGWTLIANQPEREQLQSIPRETWLQSTPDLLANPEKNGAHVISTLVDTLPDGSSTKVRVIANQFALYRVEGQEERIGRGMYDQMRGLGAHEIIIESQKQTDSLTTMLPHQYTLTLRAIQERIHDLRNDIRLHSFSAFREWTCGANSTKLHPHSQLIASAIIPLGLQNELDASYAHFDYKERCLFCDMIQQERVDETRLVTVTDDYITYCPFASRMPFEIHLFPQQHQSDFSSEPRERLTALAAMIRDTALRLEKAIPGWNVLMALHTAPSTTKRKNVYRSIPQYYHWHIEFLPHPPGLIDWYARSGTHVECTAPEKAAEFLRGLSISSPWT